MKNKKAKLNNFPCFPRMNFRKRGWMLILEATIAILIVSGALLVVYSQQVDERLLPEEYYDNLQGQILADVSSSSSLRLNVLNVVEENSGDENFKILNNFIGGKIPSGFGYSIRVCKLGDETDYCNMKTPLYIATLDRDIYTEEIIVASELGSGTDAVYNPKKLKLFVWEGDDIETDCNDTCSPAGTVYSCSTNSTQVLKKTCGDFDADYCLEYDGDFEVFKTCNASEECVESLGICTKVSGFFILTCKRTTVSETGCVDNFNDECDEWNGGGVETGSCPCWELPWPLSGEVCGSKEKYECYNIETVETGCSENPVCPSGYTEIAKKSCVPDVPCENICSPAGPIYSCDGDNKKILVRTCGNFDDDDCLEWEGDFKVFVSCGNNKQCEEGNSECVSSVAKLSLTFSNVVYGFVSGQHIYTHTRTFEESNGVGVTLTEGQLCYLVEGSCDAKGVVNYKIEGNGDLVHTDKQFFTNLDSEKFTLKYWGTDDNENDVYVEQTVCVTGSSFVENC